MYLKKTTCLLLTLALISLAVPAFADGNPPPPTIPGDGNIHPWDNNDGNRASSGPYLVHSSWMWLGYGSNIGLILMPRTTVSQQMKSYGSKSDKVTRTLSETQVVFRNR